MLLFVKNLIINRIDCFGIPTKPRNDMANNQYCNDMANNQSRNDNIIVCNVGKMFVIANVMKQSIHNNRLLLP